MGIPEIDVWLDVGRDGKCFSYRDGKCLGIQVGDIVLVRLKGRAMQGLVVKVNNSLQNSFKSNKDINSQIINLNDIEELVQKAAVEPSWKEWLEATAVKCHVSSFRMLKAALPPGWIGQRRTNNLKRKSCWWIFLNDCENKLDLKIDLSLKQKKIYEYLLHKGGGDWQQKLISEGFSSAFLKRCIEKGLIARKKLDLPDKKVKDLLLGGDGDSIHHKEEERYLTSEQRNALNVYLKQPAGSALLLWGVTGSGKTEVYLQIAEKELSQSRHCLIMAPEIGLIPQLVDRFVRRFGTKVFEYHSGCSENQRVRVWRDILTTKEPVVVIGTRSSIFLPLFPLGLIVLDEEHDNSYKQESPMPCYHARELALDRAQRSGSKVVLGSATPSLTTWKELVPKGPIALARLTSRIANKPLPIVSVVDMRQELADGNRRLISRPLLDRLSLLRESNEQAVVLVPRRGYSSFLSCRSCGDVVQCPHCDVSLTVHQSNFAQRWLSCHWCGYRANIAFRCKECGSDAFKPFGVGTQRVTEHLEKEIKGLRLLRFDRDTTRGRDGHRQLLSKFAAGEADVLIGTQMLAKGIDLPRVTLAVVLAADSLLHRPDLFAEEQTLQLFMQLAGRAGRGEKLGKVLVQTYSPDHPVIRHLVDGDYEAFLKQESNLRFNTKLAPYSRACLLRLSGESASLTATASTALAEYLRVQCKKNGWTLLGPSPALVERVAGKTRWQILLHGPESTPLPFPYGDGLWEYLPKGVNLSVDPDPIQL